MDGLALMGERVKHKLAYCGEGVKIHPLAKICKPEVVWISDNCTIGDFVFIWGGERILIGHYSHLQVNVSIWGGGRLTIGKRVSVGLGSVLLTATYDYKGGLCMVDHLPPEIQAKTLYGHLDIGDDVYIGTNCTLMPVKIGEGAVIGAGSVVVKDLDPWGIYVGNPARQVGKRPSETIKAMEGVKK